MTSERSLATGIVIDALAHLAGGAAPGPCGSRFHGVDVVAPSDGTRAATRAPWPALEREWDLRVPWLDGGRLQRADRSGSGHIVGGLRARDEAHGGRAERPGALKKGVGTPFEENVGRPVPPPQRSSRFLPTCSKQTWRRGLPVMWPVVFVTVCAGLFAGAAIYINAVEHPAWLSCGNEVALRQFAPSYHRATLM